MIPRKHAAVEDKVRMSLENEVYLRRLFREPSEMISLSCGLTVHITSSCAAVPLQNAATDVFLNRLTSCADKAAGTELEIVDSE
jgi:hypothetical protein